MTERKAENMYKRSRFKSGRLRFLLFLVFSVVWIAADIVAFRSWFLGLKEEKIIQLSTSMIQVSGILIGFTGVSVFFYMGKFEDLVRTYVLKAIELGGQLHAWHYRYDIAEAKYEEVFRIWGKNLKKMRDFKDPEWDPVSLADFEKQYKRSRRLVKDTVDSSKKDLSVARSMYEEAVKYARTTSNRVAMYCLVSVALFSLSIISGLFAFPYTVSYTLGCALDFLVFGMLILLLNWLGMQETFNTVRTMTFILAERIVQEKAAEVYFKHLLDLMKRNRTTQLKLEKKLVETRKVEAEARKATKEASQRVRELLSELNLLSRRLRDATG